MFLIIGEILIDELPGGGRPGGAPFNVARHLIRLGGMVSLVSRVGNDAAGTRLLSLARAAGLKTQSVQLDPIHQTGRVTVELDHNGVPTYDILRDVAYDHIDFHQAVAPDAWHKTIYFGSLIQRSEQGRKNLHDFLSREPASANRLYDMNLRPGCDRVDVVIPSLEKTDVLKINDEELEVTGRLMGSSLQGDALVERLMDVFGIQAVALTKGPAGAALFMNGEYHERSASDVSPLKIIDTVGAGDAFTSVLAWGLEHGLPPAEILERADRLAGRVCCIPGAVPEDDEFYEDIKTF